MKVIDKANELAKALEGNDAIQNLKSILTEIKDNPDAYRMYQDIRKQQEEIGQKVSEGSLDQAEIETLQRMVEVMKMNPLMSKLFEAEKQVQEIAQEVQGIISEPMNEVYQVINGDELDQMEHEVVEVDTPVLEEVEEIDEDDKIAQIKRMLGQ
ncbi:YlbF family regulator [Longirhabdus pacifica]|uniref:YlbF family regulator n=1 Tax=Longirhabdus pacifica TaxID=2305227 RepID=UPI001008C873|nr:YlbF family regulator [Longirhabdus pacifica]